MGVKAAGKGTTSQVLGEANAQRRQGNNAGNHRKAAHAARVDRGRGGGGLALSLVARALKKLLLLVLTHLFTALLDDAAHNLTSAAQMRDDV
jgi:hypothetical protein